jgi:hypothetical protein
MPDEINARAATALADPTAQKNESLLQTIRRNIAPQPDTSFTARGPGHQFDSVPTPQQEGEALYNKNLGTPLEQAYGKAKQFLDELQTHASEKVLKPFREGLDAMAQDLQAAAQSGHTQTGGQLTEPARALAGGVGTLLKYVPIGQDVPETVAMAANPELGPEEKGAIDLSGLRIREIPAEVPKASPEQMIKDQGLIYKGELTPGSGAHMMEHPHYPGKTATMMFKPDTTPEQVAAKMGSKLEELKNAPTADNVLQK